MTPCCAAELFFTANCCTIALLLAVKYTGNRSAVNYTVSLGDLVVEVDWNETRTVGGGTTPAGDGALFSLVRGVSEAVGVWFNLTGKMKCFDHVELGRQIGGQPNRDNTPDVERFLDAEQDANPLACGASYAHHSKTGACSTVLVLPVRSRSNSSCAYMPLRRVLEWGDLQREPSPR